MAEIAVAGAVAVLRQAISIFGNLAAKEVARLFEVKEEIGWIERELGYIQAYLKHADSIGEEHEDPVEATLEKDIRALAYDVEDIVETYFPLIASKEKSTSVWGKIKSSTIGSSKGSYAARNFVKEIEGIRRRVEDIARVRGTYIVLKDNSRARVDIWEHRKHFLHLNESKIVGFDEHIKILMGKVFDPELQHHPVISIVGMAGLGKTTLAKKVYNSVKHRFDCSAMVYVSQRPNIGQLLMEVAKQVGLKSQENVEVNLRAYLEGKRHVIVFDDIWNSQAWDHLKICIPNNCTNGSKIIITSRKTKVASLVGTVRSLYRLEPLDEKYSWNLFQDLVFSPLGMINVGSDFRELETLGRRIVEKCGGVPLAIEAVAGLLLGIETTENEWKEVLERMGQDDDNRSRVLALSYKDLPTELKPCFLYFGFFPEDYEVFASEIINIWVAEGFVRGKANLEPEDIGQDYLNQLVARNMVQVSRRRFDGSIRSCRVHDLWHTFCIMVSTQSNFFDTHHNNLSETTGVRRVAIFNNIMREHNSCHQSAKLRSVLYYHKSGYESEDIHEFFEGCKCLRVLRVESGDFPSGLMKAIESLNNLKYFGSREFKGASFVKWTINGWTNLMTLDLANMYYVNFPDEVWQMKHLRHILLNKDAAYPAAERQTKVKSRKLEVSLPSLQTLYVVPHNIFEAESLLRLINLRKLGIVHPSSSMIKVLSGVKPISDKLVRLWLFCDRVLDKTPVDLSRYQSLCRFSLEIKGSSLPRGTLMPPNLVKLNLVLAEVDDDPMEGLKSLLKLKFLRLNVNSYKRGEMVCSGGPDAFPELEVLQLNPDTSLYMFMVEQHAMPKLKRLERRDKSNIRFEVPERIRAKIF